MSALVIAVVAAGLWWARRSRRRRPADSRRALASVALHLSRATRSGVTPPEALEQAAGRADGVVGTQLGEVCAQVRRGRSFDGALADWADRAAGEPSRRDTPAASDVELLSAAARFAHRQGTRLPEAFEGVTAALVDRAEVADELTALTSQAAASIAVLCALPLIGLLMMGMLAPEAISTLFGTPAGLACLTLAVLLDVAAVALCTHLVRRVVA